MPSQVAPGTKIIERWTPTQVDFDLFAELSGDDNPIHVDPEFSARTRFGRTVSHGMLLYTKAFGYLKHHFGGHDHKTQTMMYPNPAYADEELTFEMTADALNSGSIDIEVRRSSDSAIVLTGTCRLERTGQ